jgi:hypothetical protein
LKRKIEFRGKMFFNTLWLRETKTKIRMKTSEITHKFHLIIKKIWSALALVKTHQKSHLIAQRLNLRNKKMMNLITYLKAMRYRNNRDKKLLRLMLLKILIKSRVAYRHLEIKKNELTIHKTI